MKKILIVIIIMLSTLSFAINISNSYPVGQLPTKIVPVSNSTGDYYVVLVKGDSNLLVMDSNFKALRVIENVNRDGIVDIIYDNNAIYCPGIYSGRLCILDVSGTPGRWAVKEKISTQSKIMTGAFAGNILGLLSYDKELILYDTEKKSITKRIDLPVESLSIISDDSRFYVSLFYNYNLVKKDYDTNDGVIIFDSKGNELKRLNAGKRPSYMLINKGKLIVVGYWSKEIYFFSTSTFKEIRKVDVGKYPNFPVIIDNNLWVSATGDQKIFSINLDSYKSREYSTTGRGPLKILEFKDEIYVLSAMSGTLESLNGSAEDSLGLDGYPIDALVANNKMAVVLQEDWSSISQNGKLITLE